MDIRQDRRGARDRRLDSPPHSSTRYRIAPLVYYARSAGLVKIGHTSQLRLRMLRLSPDALLAVEPGDRVLETQRHHQFAAERIRPRGDWFRPSDRLLLHINERARAYPAPDLAELLRPPSTRAAVCEVGHDLIPPNVVGSNNGGRACRTCARVWALQTAAGRRGEPFDWSATASRVFAEIMGAR